MNRKMMDCLTHPVKCRLLLELTTLEKATAKQLAETHSDIPQASLYRYLNSMTADGIIEVIEEKKIRGTIEKTYAPSAALQFSEQDLTGPNAGPAYLNLFMQYMAGFMKRFQEYCSKPDINIQADNSGFTLAPIYASDTELIEALTSYGKIIQPLLANQPSEGRKLRTLGLIISPPENTDQSSS